MTRNSDKTPLPADTTLQQLVQSDNAEDFVAAARLSTGSIISELNLEEERAEEIVAEVEKDDFYRDFKNRWEEMSTEEKASEWPQLLNRIVTIVYSCRPYCMRCGECCSRVTPSLHMEDLSLFREGVLGWDSIYTLRKGEPVLDNVRGKLENLPEEIVKIKESPKDQRCMLYEPAGKNCTRYDRRPVQCRTQECWNPVALEELWNRDKLTRRHFIEDDEGLLELLEIHDLRCSAETLDRAIKNYRETGESSDLDAIIDMIRQDMVIRNFFLNNLCRKSGELDFLLGRPLARIIEAYNLRVETDEGGAYCLVEA